MESKVESRIKFIVDLLIFAAAGALGIFLSGVVLEIVGLDTQTIFFSIAMVILFVPLFTFFLLLLALPFGKTNSFIEVIKEAYIKIILLIGQFKKRIGRR